MIDRSLPFPRVLTIAGSDSGGGAGIQADLKTFGALGAYGASVITAITAQNTQGVQGVHVVPSEMIRAQCVSVFEDIRIDAVKIGMLPNVETIQTVADILRQYPVKFVVLDPVLVATSGDKLALENTVDAMIEHLMPLATVLTPNLNELSQLSGRAVAQTEAQMLEQGDILLKHGTQAILLKGGHWQNSEQAVDWLIQQYAPAQSFSMPRIDTQHTHGTGCTLSSAIAASLPVSENLAQAIEKAKNYLQGALMTGQHWQVGHGHGPLAHFWQHFK